MGECNHLFCQLLLSLISVKLDSAYTFYKTWHLTDDVFPIMGFQSFILSISEFKVTEIFLSNNYMKCKPLQAGKRYFLLRQALSIFLLCLLCNASCNMANVVETWYRQSIFQIQHTQYIISQVKEWWHNGHMQYLLIYSGQRQAIQSK